MPFSSGSGNFADKSSTTAQTFAGNVVVNKGFVGIEMDDTTNGSGLSSTGGGAIKFVPGAFGYSTAPVVVATLGYLQLTKGIATAAITSGALSTITPSTTVGQAVSATRDVFLMQICTFNPTAGAAATCVCALSPDNMTYSTLITVTVPVGVALDGTIPPIGFVVPAGWYVKFTTTNATLGTGTYY